MNRKRALPVSLSYLLALVLGLTSVASASGPAGNGIGGRASADLQREAPTHPDPTKKCLLFDDLPADTPLTVYKGVTFTNTEGGLTVQAQYPGPKFTSPNAVLPDNFSIFGNRTRATFPTLTTGVRVTLGDYGADQDDIHLEAFDSGGNLVGSDFRIVQAGFFGGKHLLVTSATENIAYAEFWSTGDYYNSVYFDNVCYAKPQEGM